MLTTAVEHALLHERSLDFLLDSGDTSSREKVGIAMVRKKSAKRGSLKSAAKSVKVAPTKKAVAAFVVRNLDVRDIRQSLGLTRRVFSRLSQFSERAIADWEAGQSLSSQSRQRMIELKRLQEALSKVIEPTYVGAWLQAPNDAFEGLKPLEVIERGETDRIWRMLYLLESGTPS
jgi:DNA-binding transcriptional regulator YiaG